MLRKIIAVALLGVALAAPAFAQSIQGDPGQVLGNDTAAARNLRATSLTPLFDRAFGAPSVQGCLLTRGAALYTCSRTPTLGLAGTATGSITFAGVTSGGAIVSAQAAAGTPTLLLPNTSGTLASTASLPIVLNATTGALTCPTCVTSSSGGAITGTAPISVSAAGVVSITSPLPLTNGGTNASLTASNGGIVWSNATQLQILAGTATAGQMLQSGATATPAWSTTAYPATAAAGTVMAALTANTVTATPNPILGIAGTTVGDIGFRNATSGTVTLRPVTGALGTPVVLIPSASGTMAVSVSTPLSLNATTGALNFVGTSGGVIYFNSGTSAASSAALTANALVLGGGAGAAPTSLSCSTTTTLLHGGTPPTCGQLVFADIASAALATNANYFTGAASVLVPASVIYQAEVTVTYGATTTIDFDTLINGVVTLTGNISTLTLTNVKAGKAGQIRFIQSGAGSFTWPAGGNTVLKYAGGALPALTTGSATAVDVLAYSCSSATFCTASLLKDVRNP